MRGSVCQQGAIRPPVRRRGGVNVALLVLLVVVGLAAITYWIYQWSSEPDVTVQQPGGEVEMVTLYVQGGGSFEMPLTEALELEQNDDGLYRNPETGEFNVLWSPPGTGVKVLPVPE